jgi:hypothetical protein
MKRKIVLVSDLLSSPIGLEYRNCYLKIAKKNSCTLIKLLPIMQCGSKVKTIRNEILNKLYLYLLLLLNNNTNFYLWYPIEFPNYSFGRDNIFIFYLLKQSEIIYYFILNIIKRLRNNLIILFVLDLPSEQTGLKGIRHKLVKTVEKYIFSISNILWVPTIIFKKKINIENTEKVKVFGLYLEEKINKFDIDVLNINQNYIIVCLTGFWKCDEIKSLPRKDILRYKVFGVSKEEIKDFLRLNRTDIEYHLRDLYRNEFENELIKCDVGVIYYSSIRNEYFKFALSSKLTTYINCGLAIASKEEYQSNRFFIKKYSIGFMIKSLDDLKKLTIDEVYKARSNVFKIRNRLLDEKKYDAIFET